MAPLGSTIESPHELFVYKLGAALTMEEKILDMLEKLQEKAQDSALQRQLQQHHQETRQQVENLHRCFEALGVEVDKQPCPVVEALEKEGQMMLTAVDDELVDTVILGSVIETEHHEVAVYDGLIIKAETMGEDDVIALLNENLEQEDATLEKAVKAAEQMAQQLARQTA